MHQKTLQKIMEYTVNNFCNYIPDVMPDTTREEYDLMPLQTAFRHVHFPDTEDNIDSLLKIQSDYHKRIVFDEFFMLQAVLALRKKGIAKKITWVIAIVIILCFGFGTASMLSNSRPESYAGRLFGKKISFDEFELSANRIFSIPPTPGRCSHAGGT